MFLKKTAGALALLVMCGAAMPVAQRPADIVWTFDRLENIGGFKTTVEGTPKVVDTPLGKAIEFDGVDDAIWIEKHPLAGAATFTFEAIYRPDGGAFEQRWFHLAERDPKTGLLASAEHPKTGRMRMRASCSNCGSSRRAGISMRSSTAPATTAR